VCSTVTETKTARANIIATLCTSTLWNRGNVRNAVIHVFEMCTLCGGSTGAVDETVHASE